MIERDVEGYPTTGLESGLDEGRPDLKRML